MKSVIILIDYFGVWPGWFPVFLASCKANGTINWLIRTDCKIPANPPTNVRFVECSFGEYVASVSKRLNIDFKPAGPYKICDLRPMFGELYLDDIAGFDYYGFGDLDVIYGNIRLFYNNNILCHDIISSHADMVSGHLTLVKNTERMRKAYLDIPEWKAYLECPESTRFDEDVYSDLFASRGRRDIYPRFAANAHFEEQYSTVFHPMLWHDGLSDHPDVWFWKDGAITNNRNFGRQYLYLHLMNFQSMRWASEKCQKNNIPWKENKNSRFVLAGEECGGVQIDWGGIRPLSQ